MTDDLKVKFVEAFNKYSRMGNYPLIRGPRVLDYKYTIRTCYMYKDSLSFVTINVFNCLEKDDILSGYRIIIGEYKSSGENDIELSYNQVLELTDESLENRFTNWEAISSIVDEYDSKLSEVVECVDVILNNDFITTDIRNKFIEDHFKGYKGILVDTIVVE